MDDIRTTLERDEDESLAPHATRSANSRGREEPEKPHPYRTAFQRDRDRVLHSKAFRRLAHKTQVFLAPEGDHYRVRLTHTLEVTQVARTIARALQLNEDLAEAICLGHDLGHTPYGHLGEEVLSEFLERPFKHNEQSLRIVDRLETRGSRRGLNLTWEVRDGILNHTWSMPDPSTPEARVARYADRIAYVSHDIDDALRAGVLKNDDVPERTNRTLGSTSSARIDTMVASVIQASTEGKVEMEKDVFDVLIETREFLYKRVYTRPEVQSEHARARALLRALCDHFTAHPAELPKSEDDDQTRLVDYVAGMTDRFARREYERITGASVE
jgi:dGTPase